MANHKPITNRSNCSPEGGFFFWQQALVSIKIKLFKTERGKEESKRFYGFTRTSKRRPNQVKQMAKLIIRGQMVGEQMGMV
jgi:hypothetical protein